MYCDQHFFFGPSTNSEDDESWQVLFAVNWILLGGLSVFFVLREDFDDVVGWLSVINVFSLNLSLNEFAMVCF